MVAPVISAFLTVAFSPPEGDGPKETTVSDALTEATTTAGMDHMTTPVENRSAGVAPAIASAVPRPGGMPALRFVQHCLFLPHLDKRRVRGAATGQGPARGRRRITSTMGNAVKIPSVALLLLTLCFPGAAQTSSSLSKKPTSNVTFKVDVDLVLVEVGVHDEHGRAVGNLTQEDFRVFEDGKEQQILAFSHQELPLAVALVVDNSSSIMAALQELRSGALDTLALLKPDDRLAIFSFGENRKWWKG